MMKKIKIIRNKNNNRSSQKINKLMISTNQEWKMRMMVMILMMMKMMEWTMA
jgi:hypothetical protein